MSRPLTPNFVSNTGLRVEILAGDIAGQYVLSLRGAEAGPGIDIMIDDFFIKKMAQLMSQAVSLDLLIEERELNKQMESIYSIAVSVVLGILSIIFGIIATKLWSVPKIIDAHLLDFEKKLEVRLNKIDQESMSSHRRLSVHDRISSKIIAKSLIQNPLCSLEYIQNLKG